VGSMQPGEGADLVGFSQRSSKMAAHTPDPVTGEHVVQFYEHDDDLARAVGGYLVRALRADATAIVIATPGHRRRFEAELNAAGIDVTRARLDRTLAWLDAAGTLARFMSDGEIDRDAFYGVVGELVRRANERGRPVYAYGEMVALLWDAGDVLGAIELEKLWNELSEELEFALWCAYHSQSLSVHEHADAVHEVCHLHTSVVDEATARFAAAPDAPSAARRFVSSVLEREPYRDRAPLADAQLVVSELATNAVIHAGSPFSVSVGRNGSTMRVSVRDCSGTQPVLRAPEPESLSGRGLRLVGALARDWGVEPGADGKTVWAELALR
jgi:anti-sigma regulatory factor (Ser/Thr protein kinase)